MLSPGRGWGRGRGLGARVRGAGVAAGAARVAAAGGVPGEAEKSAGGELELVLRADGRVVPAADAADAAGQGSGASSEQKTAKTKFAKGGRQRRAPPPKKDNALKRLFASAGDGLQAKTREGKPAAAPVRSTKVRAGTTRLKQAPPPSARKPGQKRGQGKPARAGRSNGKPALPLPAKSAVAARDLEVSEDAGRTKATRALESSTFAAVTCFIAYPFVPEEGRGAVLALALFGLLSRGIQEPYPTVTRGGPKISPGGMKFLKAGGNYGRAFGVNKSENTETDNFAGRVILAALVLVVYVLTRQTGGSAASGSEIFLPLAAAALLLRGNSQGRARYSSNPDYGQKWKTKFWDGKNTQAKDLPAPAEARGELPAPNEE